MLYREWNLREGDEEKARVLAEQLQTETGAPAHLLSEILVARGHDTPAAAAALLQEEDTLPDPYTIKDIEKAAQRIRAAIEDEEPIVVFGDYDADGITATALLYSYLDGQGAQVFYKLPNRADDDYGLSPAVVDQVADKGISLIITVDNGTTAFEAAARAKERGVSLVVTDHHLPYDTLPELDALVNPCRTDDDSGLDGLSGVGVAFMLLAVLEGCPPAELLPLFGDLVAIGTVADVMRLVGPNRTIVRAGLALMQDTERPGLRAVMDACGLADKPVTVENISYGIAPRLNAAGRMDDATVALELLLAENEDEAAFLVEQLQAMNAARQKAEQEILEPIIAQMEADTAMQRARVLVLAGEGWHQGVIGIVASRLVDKYAKPAIVISFEGEVGKGSGRSVAGFSLHGAIASCEDILLRYGGHDLAAGFSISRQHVEDFRRRVNAWAAQNSPVPPLPKVLADVETELSALTVPEVKALERLAPCGSGNPVPRLLVRGAVVEAVYTVSEGKHCRLRLSQKGSCLLAVLFGTGPARLAYKPGDVVDVLLTLSIYEGKQGPQVSGRIVEIRPAQLGNAHVAQSALFESFYAGGTLTKEQQALLAPSREDVAAAYRAVRDAGPVYYEDLRPMFARLGEDMAGRMLAALAALEELGLIARNTRDGQYTVPQVAEKRNLAESTLLQRLQKAPAAL
ncbi:single-stranded-DNA-specific exonuclease RecJ [Ruminococcaceae bacterium OttesenSCG-928-O06]|nr:single-stranded-DNA-specific exonuclease RecJ [Ruminococcaceae bacterium OttesenSCG-928-O06]